MIDTLVMKEPHIKQLIQSLTHKYLLGLQAEAAREAKFGEKLVGSNKQGQAKQWSPDFVKGKGEGLIFLLHGKPGVGKTYTAGIYNTTYMSFGFKLTHRLECIAAHAERPLLTITCADIGTDPLKIEENLLVFFKYAKAWNAILLIDEADIFMEHRRVQDIERNSLVAAFLRALEYYQGILFLTTNRVGMFDEAFISRINLTIYYPPFSDKARAEVWESFFQKLEREREGEIRVHNNTRAYVDESKELKELRWNGREIRNGMS
jgi:SpoVK/Ycf46/Vps4 family AAA+-type ATPase